MLQALAKVAHEHPTRRPFDATTARQALTYLEDHPEAWQNLVTHRRERGLGLLRRLSTGPGSP